MDDHLCRNCWGELRHFTGGDYCPRCGKDASKYAQFESGCAKCQDTKIDFDGIARGGVYDGVLRDMLLAFKFHDRTELGGSLCMLADSTLKGARFANDIDLVVPVPLHWRRQMMRGYNQSLLLSKSLGQINKDLVRVRFTERQWDLSPAKRKSNVANAFAVRRGHNFSGKNICLVDDITTSGSTLNECAKTLKEAGANKVFAVVAAVAMQDV